MTTLEEQALRAHEREPDAETTGLLNQNSRERAPLEMCRGGDFASAGAGSSRPAPPTPSSCTPSQRFGHAETGG